MLNIEEKISSRCNQHRKDIEATGLISVKYKDLKTGYFGMVEIDDTNKDT